MNEVRRRLELMLERLSPRERRVHAAAKIGAGRWVRRA